MINFDQVGLKNNSDKALASAALAETDDIANMGEVLSAKLNYIVNEDLGISKFFTQTAGRREQFKKLYDLTGDEKWNVSLMSENYSNITYDSELDLTPVKTRRNQDTYEASVDEIKALQKQYPNSDILTPDELAFSIAERARLNREEVSRLVSRSSSNVDLVSNIVSMGGYFLDPVVLATLPFTGGASVGRGIVGNAWRSFKIETAVAGAAELAITPQVAEWKKEINSPFTLQDAAFRIIGASVGAGVARGTGSVVLDSTQLFRASRLLKKQGNNADAAIVENYAKVVEGVEPEAHNAHVQAFQASRQAFEEGRFIETAEIERIYAAHDVAVPEAVRTYHGSKAKFEKFDQKFMGTGEGNQAFGYGHYIAESRSVAQGYKEKIGGGRMFQALEINGESASRYFDVDEFAEDTLIKLHKNDGDVKKVKRLLKQASKENPIKGLRERAKKQHTFLTKFAKENNITFKGKGQLYEIDVPQSSIDKMIDLDKTIDMQNPYVKGILVDIRKELGTSFQNGKRAYEEIVFAMKLKNVKNPEKAASEYLLEKGIKGNKYFDGDSRADNTGTSNYVLFDPEDAIIVSRNDEILKQIKTRNVELRLDKTELDDLSKSQIQDVEEMINADDGMFLEVPSFKTNDATGELEISTRPAKEVFEEIDNQDKAMDDIFTCVMGAAA
tara:strand:- start:2940 stop:4955 length:2016 start_codon:yes stop_codon:yes gene_type:complete